MARQQIRKPATASQLMFIAQMTHLRTNYYQELGLLQDEESHRDAIVRALRAFGAFDPRTIENAVGLGEVRSTFRPRIKEALVNWVTRQVTWLHPEMFREPPAAHAPAGATRTFETVVAAARDEFRAKAQQIADATRLVSFKIRQRPDIITELRSDLNQHYIGYRYAIENERGSNNIAREVITMTTSNADDHVDFSLAFKLGRVKAAQPARLFTGQTLVIGQSLVSIGIHLGTDFGAITTHAQDRIRMIFMCREVRAERSRFGILSTTRAVSPWEPCSACKPVHAA